MKSNKPALMERASFKSIVSSLLAILMGLVVGFIIILIANPSDALQGLSILLTGGFREGLSYWTGYLFSCTNHDDRSICFICL